MKITGVRVYLVDVPLHEGSDKWSGGNSVSVFDGGRVCHRQTARSFRQARSRHSVATGSTYVLFSGSVGGAAAQDDEVVLVQNFFEELKAKVKLK